MLIFKTFKGIINLMRRNRLSAFLPAPMFLQVTLKVLYKTVTNTCWIALAKVGNTFLNNKSHFLWALLNFVDIGKALDFLFRQCKFECMPINSSDRYRFNWHEKGNLEDITDLNVKFLSIFLTALYHPFPWRLLS